MDKNIIVCLHYNFVLQRKNAYYYLPSITTIRRCGFNESHSLFKEWGKIQKKKNVKELKEKYNNLPFNVVSIASHVLKLNNAVVRTLRLEGIMNLCAV